MLAFSGAWAIFNKISWKGKVRSAKGPHPGQASSPPPHCNLIRTESTLDDERTRYLAGPSPPTPHQGARTSCRSGPHPAKKWEEEGWRRLHGCGWSLTQGALLRIEATCSSVPSLRVPGKTQLPVATHMSAKYLHLLKS